MAIGVPEDPYRDGTRPALRFERVRLVRGGATVLDDVHWVVRAGERWVVLGPNGSGKTSLLELASGYLHPSQGTVDVLGRRLGRVDVRRLRTRIGLTSAALAKLLRPGVGAADVVMTGKHAALETWWHHYTDEDHQRARALLDDAGFGAIAERTWAQLSEGERQQVQLARALMARPELLLLDEPNAGLDLGGRERLIRRLAQLAADTAVAPIVLVTHHVEEIPPGFTHALLVAQGRVVASGPIGQTVTDSDLSACFGVDVRLSRTGDRFAVHSPG